MSFFICILLSILVILQNVILNLKIHIVSHDKEYKICDITANIKIETFLIRLSHIPKKYKYNVYLFTYFYIQC